jgi:hypothetical protein
MLPCLPQTEMYPFGEWKLKSATTLSAPHFKSLHQAIPRRRASRTRVHLRASNWRWIVSMSLAELKGLEM